MDVLQINQLVLSNNSNKNNSNNNSNNDNIKLLSIFSQSHIGWQYAGGALGEWTCSK